jgi:tRNA 2-thiouridine synthesizing protein A
MRCLAVAGCAGTANAAPANTAGVATRGIHLTLKVTAMADMILDTKGMNCPLPILKTKKALQGIQAGGLLEVLATDPGAVADFKAFCRQTGNELVESTQDGDVYKFVIKRLK